MKKSWKQWMAITCALAMIVSLLPVTILAAEGVATPTDLAPVVETAQETEPAEELVEEPIIEEPIAEEPVVEEPIVEEPIGEEPVVEEPIVEEPIGEEPAVEGPIAEEPVVEEPIVEEPIAEEPVVEEPVVEEPIVEEPIAEETVVEEPIVEEPIAEEPVVEEPIVEEPIAEEPVVEEPVVEEPIAEEPAEGNDEPVVENNQEEPIEEIEIKPAAEEVVEEVQAIEDYENPLGLDDVIGIEPEAKEEPAEEPALVNEAEEAEDALIVETFEIPAEEIDAQPAVPDENELTEVVIVEEIPEETMDIAEGIDVREKADGMSAIFATLSANAEFAVLAVEGDWVRVVVNEQIGYIYKADLEGIIDLPEEKPDTAAPEMKVMIFSSRRTQMSEGETVYLTSKLVGLDGYEIEYQWECNKHDGAGFRDVEGANGDSYTFNATVESLSWDWRLSVFF